MYFNGELCQLFTFKDITMQTRLEREKQNCRTIRMLAASVSHDMMSPLNGILNFSQILMKPTTPESQQKRL